MSRGIALPFHDLGAWVGVGGQHHAPAALPRERPGTHCNLNIFIIIMHSLVDLQIIKNARYMHEINVTVFIYYF